MYRTFKLSKFGRNRYYDVLNSLLFSFIGLSSYSILVFYTDILDLAQVDIVFSPWACIAVVLSFNLMCFGFLKLNALVNAHYPYAYSGVGRILLTFLFIALVLLSYNYFMYVAACYITQVPAIWDIESEHVFIISIITLMELVVMSLLMLNASARFTITLYREAEALKQYQAVAEFKALQNQLNPHFLFNSLNTLLSEITHNPENAKIFTSRLADAYRYILQTQNKMTISLWEELKFLKAYVYLHEVRIGKALEFIIKMDEGISKADFKEVFLPPLSLQLLVENAIKHNVATLKRPLEITISIDLDKFSLEVENNVKLKSGVKSMGSGLNNLSERYRLLNNKNIHIYKTDEVFRVRIPLLEYNMGL